MNHDVSVNQVNLILSIETGKSESLELMATQLAKFTFDDKASVDEFADIEKQSRNYRMNLNNLQWKVQKLDDQIHQATPIIERMKRDHGMIKEQYQESKRKILAIQLAVNNEEAEIVELQTRIEYQKKKIQTIVNKIGKSKKVPVKSTKERQKKKNKSDPLTKDELFNILESPIKGKLN